MSHNHKPCKTKPCGCEDTGLHTPTPCIHDTFECPNPDPCAETFSDCCVVHNGDGIVDLGITEGARLCDMLQIITLFLTNPNCIIPGAICQSPLGLHSITITGTTVKVGWTSAGSPSAFQVEYKLASALTWTLNPALLPTATTDTIGGLTLNSDYYIRVRATCINTSCYSVTIHIKTKTS